jgi:1-acyl-sn-glycerol-3-phosphate acyltransferase
MPSWLRITIGLTYMAIATALHAVLMILLLPWRNLRIRACNYWGHVSGRFCVWLSGSTVTIDGWEHLDPSRQVIYVSNHTSILDIFLGIWLSPVGTVGVAKKEVVWYPFFGQLYLLSGHLRIDRGSTQRAVAAMRDLARIVDSYRLSIWIWPEGTRSRDGRLLPLKKGIWHLAVGTGLPVVPVVVSGAHRVWKKGSSRIEPADVHVQVLPAIDTSDWGERPIQDVLAELHAVFAAHLPPDQQPLAAAA